MGICCYLRVESLNLNVDTRNADFVQSGVTAKVAAIFKKGSVKVVPQA
jgi:hypothetical protein